MSLNAFALVFLLPSLHAWLWLPQLGDRPVAARLATWLAGLAGPALLLWEFADRFGLGLDAPWYLLQLAAVGWVPFAALALFVVWAAAAGQLAALAGGRYAPYPSASERPPLGPMRRTIRRIVLSSRSATARPSPAGAGAGRRGSLAQRQVPHGRARRELTVASRREHERVGGRGARDHVRLLAGQRLEHDALAVDSQPRSQELVPLGVAPNGGGEHARLRTPAPARATPWSASTAGRTNSSKHTSDETGFPGSPNTSVRPGRRTRSACRA